MYALIAAAIAVVLIGLNGCGSPPPPLRYTHATAIWPMLTAALVGFAIGALYAFMGA